MTFAKQNEIYLKEIKRYFAGTATTDEGFISIKVTFYFLLNSELFLSGPGPNPALPPDTGGRVCSHEVKEKAPETCFQQF